ncbi:MAG: molybdopterin-dependent oxidoreductase, partial [Woeseiaceae bacterium]
SWSAIRALAAAIAERTGSELGMLSEGPNGAGAHLAGLLPHRGPGGQARDTTGLHAADMLEESLDAMLLFGVEPDRDLAAEDPVGRLRSAGFVAAFTPFDSESLRSSADLLLPIGTFAETSGTFVNCEGRWQSFGGIANAVGDARPGWKVLRVLGNLFGIPGFDYESSEEVRDELRSVLGDCRPDNACKGEKAIAPPGGSSGGAGEFDLPMYGVDAVVRRATALQRTAEARRTAGAEPAR